MPRLRFLFAPILMGTLAAGACKQESPPRYSQSAPGPYPPYPGPPQPQPQPGPAPAPSPAPAPAPGPAPTSTDPAAAAGLPCERDADLVCPFGRCIGGRCGGCRADTDCKPNAACMGTPVGRACMPTAAPTPAPSPAPTPPPPTPTPTPTPTPATDPYAAARARCLQKTNAYRATQNVTPLTARVDREACGDEQAQADATSNAPHGSFGKCKELAQNECPGWKGNPESIVDTCLKAMFDEGPGQGPQHGHHNNIMAATYSGMSCSFFVAGDGSVWLVQNFYK